MSAQINRRSFITGALEAPWLVARGAAESGAEPDDADKWLDIHVHLFGIGDSPSGCRMSRAVTESPLFQFLLHSLRLRGRAKTIDESYVIALAQQLVQSALQEGLILAQDAVYDRAGEPDWSKTHLYVPNDYLFQVVARHPQLMIPCVSINPDRRDALTELERCVEKGARVLKIHPPVQGVNLADKKHTRFFQRCADLKTVVMIHTGHEHSAPIVDSASANPRKLELALDQGCTVVACHCGTGRCDDHPDMLPDFLAMTRRHKNLRGDTAVLGGLGRSRDFLRVLADEPVRDRLLHGSDFPLPALPMSFAGTIGTANALRLQRFTNLIQRDFELKEALGIVRASAQRAYRMIANTGVGRSDPAK